MNASTSEGMGAGLGAGVETGQDRPSGLRALPWGAWWRQGLAVARLEWRTGLLSKRLVGVYLLALTPVVLAVLHMLVILAMRRDGISLGGVVESYAYLYQSFILRVVVFFGCAALFIGLFRSEIEGGTLHDYFLSPLRRELLVLAKFLAGLAVALPLFAGATLATVALVYLPIGLAGSGDYGSLVALHAAGYVLVTMLACLGYGALFLFVGLRFRNPILPVVLVLGWEAANFLLPPLLKHVSIIYYLRSLSPVAVSDGPLALLADPAPSWLAVPGLLIVSAALVLLTMVWIRRVEIRYGGE